MLHKNCNEMWFVVCVISVARFADTLKRCRVSVELMKRFPETVAKVGVSKADVI